MNKLERAQDILSSGPMYICLNTTKLGVTLPRHLTTENHIKLIVGYNLEPPIPDLVVDEWGVSGTLTFGRDKVWCHVPWGAMVVLQSKTDTWYYGGGAERHVPDPRGPKATPPARTRSTRPSHLRLVK